MLLLSCLAGAMLLAASAQAETVTIDANSMPRIVFTGDSQTCGRVGATDYPQLVARLLPLRVINTAVGGTNTHHLLFETSGGTASISKGEHEVRGSGVSWYAGPYPGQKVRLGAHQYTIDRIEVRNQAEREVSLWIVEPAVEDFEGSDYAIEPGWRARIVEQRPDWVCFMYSVNDAGKTSDDFLANIHEIARRTRELGAQPIFLSGVPYMDREKGGTHPGSNRNVAVRARDLAQYCREHSIPYADIFTALMQLDEHCVSVWADTVHPTTDGSAPIVQAILHILRELGIAIPPRSLTAWRAPSVEPGPIRDKTEWTPLTTSQPDYSAANTPDENHFDLNAIRVRDEYGLIEAADGEMLNGGPALVLSFCAARPAPVVQATARLVLGSECIVLAARRDGKAHSAWERLGTFGPGSVNVRVPLLRDGETGEAILCLNSSQGVKLDYASLEVDVTGPTEQLPSPATWIHWPAEEEIHWSDDPSNLLVNGALTETDGVLPAGWHPSGDGALYLPARVVAQGTGAFMQDRRIDLFRPDDPIATGMVRPLDFLQVDHEDNNFAGRYIISGVEADGSFRLRRYAPEQAKGVTFCVLRRSGCLAVPGGCCIEAAGTSAWEQTVEGLQSGRYEISFFARAYAPERLSASSRPDWRARLTLSDGERELYRLTPETHFQWQRTTFHFELGSPCALTVTVESTEDMPVQYTGWRLRRLDMTD
ncbi:MAG: SGNH/GDSL hydrolase family protein [Armatimonadetes bacterium]|nr:SGNH/GDSL hydrolase family protein [Armatimonadota bacterium]